ncbi:MAG: diaminopimelate epimerase [Lachnospiraceae bacterium]|jgi:diaminopimelate epimerase|nr:diaminopimelate epimerase [Lachnospiraceae bacterium]
MKFTKMEGIGNDYVYIDGTKEYIHDRKALAIRLSERHFGVGSDGLIIIDKSEIADFKMDMYNADGSNAEMCGNGIRCVGKFVYDKGLTDKTELSIETGAGIKTLKLYLQDNKVNEVEVDMGVPEFNPEKIPMNVAMPEGDTVDENGNKLVYAIMGYPLLADKTQFKVTALSMGNPHVIVFTANKEDMNYYMEEFGEIVSNHKLFPNKVNAEFVNIISPDTIEMRVYERGTGETYACGTGATAAAIASYMNGYTGNEVTVKLKGGDLKVKWDLETHHAFLRGAATTVFEGELDKSFWKK